MNTYIIRIFNREVLKTNAEISNWWNKGRILLNVCFLGYSILHFLFIVIFLKNGFVFFLLPMIPILLIIINIFFSLGLTIELVAKNIFKSHIDFDKISPIIKVCEFIIILISVLFLSISNIINLM